MQWDERLEGGRDGVTGETKPLRVFSVPGLTDLFIVRLIGAPPHWCNREEW